MDDLQEQLQRVLNDPEQMKQVMAIAQSLGGNLGAAPGEAEDGTAPQEAVSPSAAPPLGGDFMGILGQLPAITGLDARQKNLLAALKPYLSPQKSQRLEEAMRIAHIAGFASDFLNRGGGNRV